MAKKTILYTANVALLTAANNWMRPWGRGNNQPSVAPGGEDSGEVILFPVPGVLRNLRVRARTALTGTGNIVYTSRKDGVDQLLAVTIAQNANPHVGQDLVNEVTVAAGESVNMRMMQAIAPSGAGADITAAMEFETQGSVGFFHWGFGNNLPIQQNGGIPGYGSAFAYIGNEGRHVFRVPRPGYLRGLYVKNGTDFTSGTQYSYSLSKNGVATNVGLTIPDDIADNEANDSGAHTVQVAAGDTLELTCTPNAASGCDRMSAAIGYYF